MATAKSTKNPSTKIATCNHCGAEFPKINNRAYCSDSCRREFMRTYHREWKRRNEAPKRAAREKVAKCFGGCGAFVEYITNARVYCISCRLEIKRESARKAMAKRRASLAGDYRYAQSERDRLNLYREINRERLNKKELARKNDNYKNDAVFALSQRVRARIRQSIRRMGLSKNSSTLRILGLSEWSQFADHMERQFTKGMSWDNRGQWHIDHIVPISSAETEQEVLALNHFTNLRPMWAAENMSKGAAQVYLI